MFLIFDHDNFFVCFNLGVCRAAVRAVAYSGLLLLLQQRVRAGPAGDDGPGTVPTQLTTTCPQGGNRHAYWAKKGTNTKWAKPMLWDRHRLKKEQTRERIARFGPTMP